MIRGRHGFPLPANHTDGVARYAAYLAASTPAEGAPRTVIPLAAAKVNFKTTMPTATDRRGVTPRIPGTGG